MNWQWISSKDHQFTFQLQHIFYTSGTWNWTTSHNRRFSHRKPPPSPAGISRKGRNWYSQSNYETLPFWKYYDNTIWKIVPNDQIKVRYGLLWQCSFSLPRPANAICASQAHQNLCVLDAHSHLSPWGMAGFFSTGPSVSQGLTSEKNPKMPPVF